jgi:hypothetical protein
VVYELFRDLHWEANRRAELGETAEELVRRKGHLPLLVAMSVVLPAEGHGFAIEGQQAVITDGNAMRIPPKIVKHLSGSAKCRFRVYNPILLEERINKRPHTHRTRQPGLVLPPNLIGGLRSRDVTKHDDSAGTPPAAERRLLTGRDQASQANK